MANPIIQEIRSTYDSRAARRYIEDLRKMREEMERFAKVQGAKGTDGGAMAASVREHTQAVRDFTRATKAQTEAQKEKARTDRQQADAAAAARRKEADAMKAMREITALARIEFDKMNLANRRGDLSNEQFAKGVTELRQRVTPQLLAISQQFEKMPRSVEVAYGRSLVALDRFGTRSTEILTQQTRLRTRITQAIQDAVRMQASMLPGGRLMMGMGGAGGLGGLSGGAVAGAAAGIGAAAVAVKATQAAIRFEDALSEVRKTAGLTRVETQALGDDILALSVKLGTAEGELARIAGIAGQMGITGSENILAFTETVAMMAATTELSADEAASAMGSLANVFQIPIREIGRLGSVVNDLSNTTNANARQIVDALQRVGPVAQNLGLTFDQVAAMVTRMIAAGIESETAGTIMRNMLTLVQTRAADVAKTLGITEQAFRDMLAEDAQGAILAYLDALGRLDAQMQTIEINRVFGQRNLVGIQALVNAARQAEGSMGTLRDTLEDTARSITENTSLTNEFAESLDRTSQQAARLRQRWDLFISRIGEPTNNVLRAALTGLNSLFDAVDRRLNQFEAWRLRVKAQNLGTPFVTGPEPDFDLLGRGESSTGKNPNAPPSIRERIEALEEERKLLIEQGQATERLAEINRQLVGYREQLRQLESFGISGQSEDARRAQELIGAVLNMQREAEALSTRERRALSEIVTLQKTLSDLKAADNAEAQEGYAAAVSFLEAEIAKRQKSIEDMRTAVGKVAATMNDVALPDSTDLRDVDDLERKIELLKRNLEGSADSGEDLKDTLQGMALSIRTVTRLADVFGDLNDDVRNFALGVADAVDNISRLELKAIRDDTGAVIGKSLDLSQLPQAIGAAAGIISAVHGLANMIFDSGRQEREESRRLREAMRDAAREFRDAVRDAFTGGRVGEGTSPESINAVKSLFTLLRTAPTSILGNIGRDVIDQIMQFGLPGFEQFQKSILQRFQQLVNEADPQDLGSGRVSPATLFAQAVREIVGKDSVFSRLLDDLAAQIGEFTPDVAGAVDQLRFFTQFMGEEGTAALQRFTQFLLSSVDGLTPALRALIQEASGLDVSTEAGRARLAEIVRTIAASFPDFLGGLTSGELESILQELKALAENAPAQGGLAEDAPLGVRTSRTLQFAELLGLGANELAAAFRQDFLGLIGGRRASSLGGRLGTADLTTEEGREQWGAAIAMLAKAVLEGTTLRDFGLTEEQADAMIRAAESIGRIADQQAPEVPEEERFNATMTNLRQFTQAQGAELVFIAIAQLGVLEDIRDALTGRTGFQMDPRLSQTLASVQSPPSPLPASVAGGSVVNSFGDVIINAPWTDREAMIRQLASDFERELRRRLP